MSAPLPSPIFSPLTSTAARRRTHRTATAAGRVALALGVLATGLATDRALGSDAGANPAAGSGLSPLPSQQAVADGKQPKGARSPARAAFIRSHYRKHELRIPMRDGVTLFTSVYTPLDASPSRRYPILLVRTPYSVAPYGADRYKDRLGPFEEYEGEGFIFVFQDVRGCHMSEGEFVNMRPHHPGKAGPRDIDESSDTHDTIEWLVKRLPHHNGRVGMWGISYPGFYASAGSIDSHPALKAVSPQAPIADWFRGDDVHRHGAFNLEQSFEFFPIFGRTRQTPTDDEKWEPFDFGTPDRYQYFLSVGPISAALKRFAGPVPFWNDIVAHPNYDAFWQSRNLLPHLRGVRAAMLVVGGWYDMEDLYGALATYAALRAQNPGIAATLVMGPWIHGGWSGTDGAALGDSDFGFATSETFRSVELGFFKHHLKAGPAPDLSGALVFETGANRWGRFPAWPPPAAQEKTLYFGPARSLSFTPPAPSSAPPAATAPVDPGYDEYESDPTHPVPCSADAASGCPRRSVATDQRFASARPDVLTYRSEPLTRDLTLAGPVEATLWVSTNGSDADYIVKIIDENPPQVPDAPERGGQQTLIRVEPFRARFRDSYSQPKPLLPGQPTRIRFALNDVFHTFQRKHRLVVHVQSSLFPFIDRNPQRYLENLFHVGPADYLITRHRLHRTPTLASQISVR
ncbi:MAG TPA: CocE/NonD family hydrolase, partial [Pseudomonadota bacterium]|nr:CocE/NonD family hydrolase [Pseudomonadota bacterium]